jgi:hypothetical protein
MDFTSLPFLRDMVKVSAADNNKDNKENDTTLWKKGLVWASRRVVYIQQKYDLSTLATGVIAAVSF